MKATLAAAAATLATIAITNLTTPEPDIVYQTEVVERTIVLTVEQLDEDLADECIAIIVRLTGDPAPGVRNLIDRHYDGDACKAAQEAIRGDW
jgi:hypothetical protein